MVSRNDNKYCFGIVSMSRDYKALGFKAGLKIYQQLDTHKLFCQCQSSITEDATYTKDCFDQRKVILVMIELRGKADGKLISKNLHGEIVKVISSTTQTN